jgi:ferredoxin
MALQDDFTQAFGVWEEARPFVHLLADEQEMRLILALQDQAVAVAEVAERLSVAVQECTALLDRAYSRYLVDRQTVDGTVIYTAGSFSQRLDHLAKYEAWDEIPAEHRRCLDRRFLAEFVARHRPSVEKEMRGLAAENALPNDSVLLLAEVEEMIDAATHVMVQPCDCRRLGQNCARPLETCIWLDEGALEALQRGHGRRITREQAKQLVRWADKQGLMHTADSEWRTRGLHAICNCCACDCYPFRAAQELGSWGVWPRVRYVAARDTESCNLCGACVRRCHFGAFYHDGSSVWVADQEKQAVLFDAGRCWGCGLCANACPAAAIEMKPLLEKDCVRGCP